MVRGQCPHPWNKNKKGTFRKGHKNVNPLGFGQFKKGDKISEELKEKNKILGKKRYSDGNHPFKSMNEKRKGKVKYGYGLQKREWIKLKNKIKDRDNWICQSCGKDLKKYRSNCHHILPFKFGGSNDETNLTTLCIPCHSSIEHYTQKALVNNMGGEPRPNGF